MYICKIIITGTCLILRDNLKLWGMAFLLAEGFWQQSAGQTWVGFEPIAESDTIYQFDTFTADRWVDNKPKLLLRSFGYPEPKQKDFVVGIHYLYSILFEPPELKTEYVFTDSLETGSMIAGDFDADGKVEVMGNQDFYMGAGTEISILEFTEGTWKEYREAIPFEIDAHFAVDIFDDQGDDFIFAFGMDTTNCDTCYYDFESSSPVGLIYGDWDGESLNLHVDSTFHYTLQSLGAVYGDPTFIYIYETIFDSASTNADGPEEIGSLVKYRFDKESAKLERLYYAECPHWVGGFTEYNFSGVYVYDSLIVIQDDNAMQWFVDDGESLNLTLMQFTPFDCYQSLLFDIDQDGVFDLICADPVVKDSIVEAPNWVIKAYKLLEQ